MVDELGMPLKFDRSHQLLAMVMGNKSLVDRESCKLALQDKSNLHNKLKGLLRFSPGKIPLDIVFGLGHIH